MHEIVSILNLLARRRGWIAVSLVVAVIVGALATFKVNTSPPFLHSNHTSYGESSSEVLVDSANGALTDVDKDIVGLSTRASVYARFIQSTEVRRSIARTMRIPDALLSVSSSAADPAAGGDTSVSGKPLTIQNPQGRFVVATQSQSDIPIVSVQGLAPTAGGATRLVNAAASALTTYSSQLRTQAGDKDKPNAIIVRQVATASGGTITASNRYSLGVAVAAIVFIILLIAVIFLSAIRREMRANRIRTDLSSFEQESVQQTPRDVSIRN